MQDDVIIRKAVVGDVPSISATINIHAPKGIMLPRPISQIYDNVRDYHVVEYNSKIIGCGALHVTWSDLAEIRALSIQDEFMGKGYGRRIVEKLLEEAKTLEVKNVFVLTYQDKFFRNFGFSEIDKAELPHKIWSECVNCIHFPNCDEIAMIKNI
ncbi:N-acetyltransferase [Candidatus Latescibacterota bacterium]